MRHQEKVVILLCVGGSCVFVVGVCLWLEVFVVGGVRCWRLLMVMMLPPSSITCNILK